MHADCVRDEAAGSIKPSSTIGTEGAAGTLLKANRYMEASPVTKSAKPIKMPTNVDVFIFFHYIFIRKIYHTKYEMATH